MWVDSTHARSTCTLNSVRFVPRINHIHVVHAYSDTMIKDTKIIYICWFWHFWLYDIIYSKCKFTVISLYFRINVEQYDLRYMLTRILVWLPFPKYSVITIPRRSCGGDVIKVRQLTLKTFLCVLMELTINDAFDKDAYMLATKIDLIQTRQTYFNISHSMLHICTTIYKFHLCYNRLVGG